MSVLFKNFKLIVLLLTISFNAKSQSVLWIIEDNGLKKPSYIFGSIHEMCKENFKWDIKLERAIENTQQVYFEIDLDNFMEYFRQNRVEKIPKNYSLRDFYNEEDYELVANYFKELHNVDIEKTHRTPLFLTLNYGLDDRTRCRRVKSYEGEILKISKEKYNMPLTYNKVKGLESMYERDSIFKTISLQKQAEILLNDVKRKTTFKNSNEMSEVWYARLISAYYSMDLEGILNTLESIPPDFEYLLLEARNRLWLQKMPSIMEEKSTFFVVGAAHLGGENGVINLLKEQGYTVRPLKMAWNLKK